MIGATVLAVPFENACFVSYRHGREPGTRDLYLAFREELARQIDLYMPNHGVYLDETRLAGGAILDGSLARALCRSVCMVVLVTPMYFDATHTYCAREYRAMEQLEAARRAKIPGISAEHGLIIPVVIRGSLPGVMGERMAVSLDAELLAARDMRRQVVRKKLAGLAGSIYERFVEYSRGEDDPCGTCDDFAIPSDADVIDLLGGMGVARPRFPWRQAP